MGKHRLPRQDAIFLKFMESHVEIARGHSRGDRVAVAEAWSQLAIDLNANGPPCKSTEEWKRVWKDWKQAIKRKAAKTANKPQENLTATEDALASIILVPQSSNDITEVVVSEHSSSSYNFITECLQDIEAEDLVADQSGNVHVEEPAETPSICEASNRLNISKPDLSRLVAEENATLQLMANEIRALNNTAKSGVEAILSMGQRMCSLMEKQLEERKQHNVLLEKLLSNQNK